MTLLEAIQEVVAALTVPSTFIYADLFEANFSVDKLVENQTPVIIVLPITVTDNVGTTGVLKSTTVLQAFVLAKDPNQITLDYQAAEKEISCIAPMRLLAREMIFRLNQHAIIDPEGVGIDQVSYQAIYSSIDATLYGVLVTATVPFMEGITGCRH